MSWNYRIIEIGNNRAIHEVYYNEEHKPIYYTANPVEIVWEKDIVHSRIMNQLLEAFAYEVLTPEDFNNDEEVF